MNREVLYLEFYADDEAKAIATRDLLRLMSYFKIGILDIQANHNWAGDITLTVAYKINHQQ